MYQGTFSAKSNQADWQDTFEIRDSDTDALVDLTDATIIFELRLQPNSRVPSASFLNGATSPILSATTDNGKITIVSTGIFQLWFTREDMQTLGADTYDVGCVITISSLTTQLIAAAVPVVDGIVSQ